MLSQVHARTRDCEQRGVRRARTAVSAEGPKRRSKEFWVLSLPVLPGYRSGALTNLREEAPSHTASRGARKNSTHRARLTKPRTTKDAPRCIFGQKLDRLRGRPTGRPLHIVG